MYVSAIAKAIGLIHAYPAEAALYHLLPSGRPFPFAVNRYIWRGLWGLSGMVISRSSSLIRGLRYLLRNFVRFVQDRAAMRSVIPCGVWHRLNILRLSSLFNPNLVPTWSRLGPDLAPSSSGSALSSFVIRCSAPGCIGNLATKYVRSSSVSKAGRGDPFF
jgi:hypothetical protein